MKELGEGHLRRNSATCCLSRDCQCSLAHESDTKVGEGWGEGIELRFIEG